MSKQLLHTFRIIAICEGISFLVLLFIAMPLKYFMEKPLMVTVVGYAHGVLFIGFILFAVLVKLDRRKTLLWLAGAFLASLIPFGTFVLDKSLKKDKQLLGSSPERP